MNILCECQCKSFCKKGENHPRIFKQRKFVNEHFVNCGTLAKLISLSSCQAH